MKTLRNMLSIGLLLATLQAFGQNNQQSLLLIAVEQAGIQTVSITDIAATGLNLTELDAADLALYANGIQVPMYISNLVDGKISSQSNLEFIGEPEKNLYQDHTNYYLTLGSANKIELLNTAINTNAPSASDYLKTELFAPNTDYHFGSPTNDPWYAERILSIDVPQTASLLMTANNISQNSNEAQLNISLWGGSDYPQEIDHYLEISLNGQFLGSYSFDGINQENLSFQIDSSLLQEGSNTISVYVPNSTGVFADVIHIESWEIEYRRELVLQNNQLKISQQQTNTLPSDVIFSDSFDGLFSLNTLSNASNSSYSIFQIDENNTISKQNQYQLNGNCQNTVNMTCELQFMSSPGSSLYVSSDENSNRPAISIPSINQNILFNQAQYLIISHPDFINDELDVYVNYKSTSYQIQVVNVEQIYAQFGYHNTDASAIHEYIKFATQNMGTQYVMLIGGDTYDYHNILNLNAISYIPTIYAATDDLISYAPVDAKYADIDNDNIPDIALGRLPVRTEADLTVMLNKIYAYDQKDYAKTALISADEFDTSQGYSFTSDANQIINSLPLDWQNNLSTDSLAFMDADGLNIAQSKIINGINAGVALTSFVGHSGTRAWSFSRLLKNSHVNALANSNRPTIVTQWGCWNTYFVSPQENTMAHAFMFNPNGGAVASLGASTLTKAATERALSQLFIENLVNQQQTLGDAVKNAKIQLAQSQPEALDVILGWNIMGDPTIKL